MIYWTSDPMFSFLALNLFACLSLQRKRVQQRVRRIDRSMIGSPTNFQHTGHIGSGDVDTGNSRLRAIQNQMQSKGGYETAFSTVQVKHGFVWVWSVERIIGTWPLGRSSRRWVENIKIYIMKMGWVIHESGWGPVAGFCFVMLKVQGLWLEN